MGYMVHHTIVVTTFSMELCAAAHSKAMVSFDWAGPKSGPKTHLGIVTPILCSPCNAYYSFTILTDGSKEGWDESRAGDKARAQMVTWLRNQADDDGGNAFKWAEVQYGDERGDNRLLSTEQFGAVTEAP